MQKGVRTLDVEPANNGFEECVLFDMFDQLGVQVYQRQPDLLCCSFSAVTTLVNNVSYTYFDRNIALSPRSCFLASERKTLALAANRPHWQFLWTSKNRAETGVLCIVRAYTL